MASEFIVSDTKAAPSAAISDAQTGTAVPDEYNVSAEKVLMDNLMILALLFFIFYFMLIRPQQRRIKAHQKMVSELAKGKKVVTAGGLIGTIVKFEGDDVVVLEVAPEVRVRITRSGISESLDASSGSTANDN